MTRKELAIAASGFTNDPESPVNIVATTLNPADVVHDIAIGEVYRYQDAQKVDSVTIKFQDEYYRFVRHTDSSSKGKAFFAYDDETDEIKTIEQFLGIA